VFFKMSDMYGLGPEPELHSFGLVGVSGWGFSLEWWGWGGCCGALRGRWGGGGEPVSV